MSLVLQYQQKYGQIALSLIYIQNKHIVYYHLMLYECRWETIKAPSFQFDLELDISSSSANALMCASHNGNSANNHTYKGMI